jgi:hypothetical protein
LPVLAGAAANRAKRAFDAAAAVEGEAA